jgi:hypothetical protein
MKRFAISTPTCRNTAQVLAAIIFLLGNAATAAPVASDNTNIAKNLARMNVGAQIEATTPEGRVTTSATTDERNESAAALIMDDDSISCPLPEGVTTFVLKLPNTAALDRFSFVNENAQAAGELKIFVSNYRLPASSPKWVEVDGAINFSRKRLFSLSLVGVEARYVKLSFHVQTPGRIASLGLYGAETLERFAARQQQNHRQIAWAANQVVSRRLEDTLNFSFANLYANARVVYVSSGVAPAAMRMIDDDRDTGFRFDPADPHPTAIIELAESQRLRRVSARYDMAPGRMDVYLLKSLGDDPGNFDGLKPVASFSDANALGKAGVDFDPQGARYVALRWTPAAGNQLHKGFEVVEINAFGDMPLALLHLDTAPQLYASGFDRLQFTSEGSPELSSTTLGTVAVPPTLPMVSP